MTSLMASAYHGYRYYLYDVADTRCSDWLLSGSPWYPVIVICLYVFVVKVVIPRFMRNRPAYNLDKVIAAYNMFQILACFHLFFTGYTLGWGTRLRIVCEGVDDNGNPDAPFIRTWIWRYYMLKIVDFVETVFFLLRHKQNQVTFLHVYHHAGMVVVGFLGVRYVPGGHGLLGAATNCFVHVVMYAYYFVTNTWPQYKKNIWWKKHITQLQMVQFVLLILHSLPTLFLTDCAYPALMGGILVFQNLFFFALFFNFYRRTYGKKRTT